MSFAEGSRHTLAHPPSPVLLPIRFQVDPSPTTGRLTGERHSTESHAHTLAPPLFHRAGFVSLGSAGSAAAEPDNGLRFAKPSAPAARSSRRSEEAAVRLEPAFSNHHLPLPLPPPVQDVHVPTGNGKPSLANHDGWTWRKYGEKIVKGNPNPRSYYKCSFPDCGAKKIVERDDVGDITNTECKGQHTHPPPAEVRPAAPRPRPASQWSKAELAAALTVHPQPPPLLPRGTRVPFRQLVPAHDSDQDGSDSEEEDDDSDDPYPPPSHSQRTPATEQRLGAGSRSSTLRPRDTVAPEPQPDSRYSGGHMLPVYSAEPQQQRRLLRGEADLEVGRGGSDGPPSSKRQRTMEPPPRAAAGWDDGGRQLDGRRDDGRRDDGRRDDGRGRHDGGLLMQMRPPPPPLPPLPLTDLQRAAAANQDGDGYRWRKYGQKTVKGGQFPRSYFRCTTPDCPVRKHVERMSDNPGDVVVTYENHRHSHAMPPPRALARAGGGGGYDAGGEASEEDEEAEGEAEGPGSAEEAEGEAEGEELEQEDEGSPSAHLAAMQSAAQQLLPYLPAGMPLTSEALLDPSMAAAIQAALTSLGLAGRMDVQTLLQLLQPAAPASEPGSGSFMADAAACGWDPSACLDTPRDPSSARAGAASEGRLLQAARFGQSPLLLLQQQQQQGGGGGVAQGGRGL